MKKELKMPIVHANTAGIDIGSKEHWVAVNQNPEDVRVFGVYEKDHKALGEWLKTNHIEHVVMEATGSYWQTLFNYLEKEGFKVLLCNTKIIKNPKGKSDNKDCMWLQKLHSLGLIHGSFVPDASIEKIRQYNRYRNALVEERTACINRMQKALQLLNVRLDVVLSDITGKSGLNIINAILNGERNPKVLASLAHGSVKKSQEEIAAALDGNYREELLFQLEDQLSLLNRFNASIERTECKVAEELQKVEASDNYDANAKVVKKKPKKVNIKSMLRN